MKRTMVMWMAAALVTVSAGASWAGDAGTVRGTVSAVVPVDGGLLVVLKGEGIWQATATVSAENKPAFTAASALKPGDRVTLAWVIDGGRNMVREIVKGDGEKTQALPRTEGANIPHVEVDKPAKEGGDKPADERAWEAQREKEAKQALKEKQYREYQELRAKEEAARKEKEVKANEAAARDKEVADKDARVKTEAVEKEARAKVEARERYNLAKTEAAGTRKTTARVVKMEEADENTRALKLAALESGEEMIFKVSADQEKLYDAVGQLKEGQTVRVSWKTENGVAALVSISASTGEKDREKEREKYR